MAIQQKLHDEVIASKTNSIDGNRIPNFGYIICCEHPHVYTIGTSGVESHLLIDNSTIEAIGASVYKTNRGGDVTYHGPGQLVIYFILDLVVICPDLHKYLRLLEEIVIRSLYDFAIESGRIGSLTGVWVGPQGKEKKICAVGIRVKNWVTMHGIALNVNTDLKYFNYIIPCGIRNKGVVSMKGLLSKSQELNIVAINILQNSEKLFGLKITEV